MPGNLQGADLENFIRDAASTYSHQTCIAKMGRDSMAVVDSRLKVYGVENLRIAAGSILPRVTTGNTTDSGAWRIRLRSYAGSCRHRQDNSIPLPIGSSTLCSPYLSFTAAR